ncbi:proline-, glutamic acid- and leucine-rich protein 1-like [Dreissena polymorpha]|uniref:proline-, glutamic acid- and leucine-rich protein 1-like n=1 Tax=Dreissena polymorpha TaxID=45954 RepID=UPI00226488E4|nr:proline-, glutamic acid- and leucine-rich protein 1-like [Dreissena polymorpha]
MAAPMRSMMEKVLNNNFHKYAVQRSGDLQLQSFVKVIETNTLLLKRGDEGSNDIVGYIHQCLNNSKQRYEGLMLLSVLVKQSSTAVFQKNAVTWLKLLLNILQGHCPVLVHKACCKLLSQVIYHSDSFSDVSREVTSSFIPQLLPLLLSCEPRCLSAALTCVSTCIRKYPGPVGPFKGKLQTLVEQELANGKNYAELYECFALLTSCGSGGNLGVKHTEAWSELAEWVLASLHETLSCMYSDKNMGLYNSLTLSRSEAKRKWLCATSIKPDQPAQEAVAPGNHLQDYLPLISVTMTEL